MDDIFDDDRIRLLTHDMGDHLVIRSYFGNGTLEDVVAACISATISAGKPAVFRDELGVETLFHRESVVAERCEYMRKQRAAQKAASSLLKRALCWFGFK